MNAYCTLTSSFSNIMLHKYLSFFFLIHNSCLNSSLFFFVTLHRILNILTPTGMVYYQYHESAFTCWLNWDRTWLVYLFSIYICGYTIPATFSINRRTLFEQRNYFCVCAHQSVANHPIRFHTHFILQEAYRDPSLVCILTCKLHESVKFLLSGFRCKWIFDPCEWHGSM